jgi:hypothetical protein
MKTSFFANSDLCDHAVLRPLSHIFFDWELEWDATAQKYDEKTTTYAKLLNELIVELEQTEPPATITNTWTDWQRMWFSIFTGKFRKKAIDGLRRTTHLSLSKADFTTSVKQTSY